MGEGSFSTVYKAKDGEKLYAVKFARVEEQTRRALEKEVPRRKGRGSLGPFKTWQFHAVPCISRPILLVVSLL